MHSESHDPRLADAAVPAAINAVINGAIAWSSFSSIPQVPLSMDSIGDPGVTALGNAATLVFALSFILSCITFFMFRARLRKRAGPAESSAMPFLPTGLMIALRNQLTLFGAFVALAVLWQRALGTVMVSPLAATLLIAFVAALVTALAQLWTERGLLGASAR